MKKNIVIIACVLILAILGTGAGMYFFKGDDEMELAENQRYVYAYIQTMQGNEMTYQELEESVVTAYLESQESESETQEGVEKESKIELGQSQPDEMPSMENMPDMSQMPSMENMPDMSQMPSRGEGERRSDMSERPDMNGNMQTITALIPVGITVHTTTDTKTTFGRLVSGDMIKILMETNAEGEEVITEIWMM